jgi:hypothetical protein
VQNAGVIIIKNDFKLSETKVLAPKVFDFKFL